jgi:uncharacterized caspase-like protein
MVGRLSLIGAFILLLLSMGYGQARTGGGGSDLYALSIGVSDYHNYGTRNPRFATKDATDFSSTLEQTARNRFRSVHVTTLLDGQATRSGIEKAIRNIVLSARAQDTFAFFFSGHGKSAVDKRGKESQFYLIPSDFNASRDHLDVHAISALQLQSWLIQIECERQFVAFDASKSSSGFADFKKSIDIENKRLAGIARRDIVILSVNNWSFEFADMGHGLLTDVLLRGLNGAAALPTGDIEAAKLAEYVSNELPQVLKKHANAKARSIMRQFPGSGRPLVYSSGDDFVLGGKTASNGATTSLPSRDGQTSIFQNASFIEPSPTPQCDSTIRPSVPDLRRSGKDFALLIAVDKYKNWDGLVNPVFDAQTLAETLHDRYNFTTEVLTNPVNECIDDAVRRYKGKTYAPDGQLLVFFAGHGYYDTANHTGWIIANDSKAQGTDPFGRSYTMQTEFRRMIGYINCKHILLLVDACQSGSIADGSSQEGGQSECDDTSAYNSDSPDDRATRLLACKTRVFITSGDKEFVQDGERGQHSPFAGQLLKALQKDNNNDRFVSLEMMYPIIDDVRSVPPVRGNWSGGRGNFLFFLH